MKILTIVGTRPELIKLSLVISELDKFTTHILVHTGQNYDYELNQVFFENLKIRKPDYFLDSVGKTVAQTIGCIISRSYDIMIKAKPDALLVYGDTNSCLCVLSAKRLRIPVFHMEAGNRCFDQRVPEELNRKIVDHLSDINMTNSEHARRYLIEEGIHPETIIRIGSPMKEVLKANEKDIECSRVLERLNIFPREYFVFSAHREENVDDKDNFKIILETVNKVAAKYEKKIIASIHPRTMKHIQRLKKGYINSLFIISKPFGFHDYIKLQRNALCVISDSGTLTEESSILNFPAITIRQTHERPEGMDEASIIMSGLNPQRVIDSIDIAIAHYKRYKRSFKIVKDYDTENVSMKVVRIILSYIEYINRTVWYKYD